MIKWLPMNEIWKLILLAIVGLIAGFVNVVAGGGSFLTLPVLIFAGLPGPVANGTNRIGILIQNIFAVARFHKLKVFPWKFALAVITPATMGAIIGAFMATEISDAAFRKILAVIMIGITFVSLYFKPTKRLQSGEEKVELGSISWKKWAGIITAFFFIGIYGGFVQAGVGFLILSAIVLSGFDLVRGNAIKVFVVLIFTIFALGIFISKGQVNWSMGLSLAVGTTIGGQFGAIASVKKGNKFIQKFVTVAIIVFAIKLLIS